MEMSFNQNSITVSISCCFSGFRRSCETGSTESARDDGRPPPPVGEDLGGPAAPSRPEPTDMPVQFRPPPDPRGDRRSLSPATGPQG